MSKLPRPPIFWGLRRKRKSASDPDVKAMPPKEWRTRYPFITTQTKKESSLWKLVFDGKIAGMLRSQRFEVIQKRKAIRGRRSKLYGNKRGKWTYEE